MKKNSTFKLILLVLLFIALAFEVIRDALAKNGDFAGYVLTGNLVLDGENIYSDALINTWPPFFALVSVPIAIFDNFNLYICRFTWLSLTVLAMFFVVQFVVRMALNKNLHFSLPRISKKNLENEIPIHSWLVLVPFLISFRYLLDNLANIQINVFILFFTVLSIYYFSKGKKWIAALFLAFGISLKVYPVFLLLYFIVKREWTMVGKTLFFCVGFASLPFMVFGYEQTVDYYSFWYNQNVVPFASVAHKNQSYFSMMRSLLTHESPGLNQPLNEEIYVNVFNLSIEQVKLVSYALLILLGSSVVYLFREKLSKQHKLKAFLEYTFILTIIPILSPLAWKAYFIFLFPAYFINFLFLFEMKNMIGKALRRFLLVNYYLSILLVVFSSELFLGKYYSDVMEAYSCITIGTIVLAGNILCFYINIDKYHQLSSSD
ncbi:MAG: glycosyltransferase family 87 protein [Saprospiraceae bacterium]|nr:glycosyltransferase family 87 protein [Saprospiraceae bacterium]